VAARDETRLTAGWALRQILLLLHPFMPFVTEELAEKLGMEGTGEMLISARWPADALPPVDAVAAAEMDWVIALISQIRAVRAEMNVPPGAKIPAFLQGADAGLLARLESHRDYVLRLARLSSIGPLAGEPPKGSVQVVVDAATNVVLPLAEVIDIAAERARLEREIGKLDGEIGKIDAKLGNANFVARAPEDVVEEQRERRADAAAAKEKLAQALERLRSA